MTAIELCARFKATGRNKTNYKMKKVWKFESIISWARVAVAGASGHKYTSPTSVSKIQEGKPWSDTLNGEGEK